MVALNLEELVAAVAAAEEVVEVPEVGEVEDVEGGVGGLQLVEAQRFLVRLRLRPAAGNRVVGQERGARMTTLGMSSR